jgi:hypothetical protein
MSFFTYSGNKLAATVIAAGALVAGGTGVAAFAQSPSDEPTAQVAETESPSSGATETETDSRESDAVENGTESSEPAEDGTESSEAAANDGLRSQAEGTIRNIINSFTHSAPTTPPPAPPAKAPEPAPAVVPSPAATTPAAFVPAVPSPVRVPGSEPSAADPQENSEAPGRLSKEPQKAHAPSAVPPGGGRPAAPGASHAGYGPSRWSGPAAGREDASNNGNANNGNARGKGDDGGAGQGSGQPRISPTPGNQR